MKSQKTRREEFFTPKNRKEFEQLVSEVNEASREIQRIKLEEDYQIQEIIAQKYFERKPYEEKIEQGSQGIAVYANANRAELTDNFKIKTLQIVDGKILWRKNPPSVEIIDEDKALEELKREKLRAFIRTEEKIDKEAILKNKLAIASLKFLKVLPGEEQFVIQPAGVKFELVKGKRKFKIKPLK